VDIAKLLNVLALAVHVEVVVSRLPEGGKFLSSELRLLRAAYLWWAWDFILSQNMCGIEQGIPPFLRSEKPNCSLRRKDRAPSITVRDRRKPEKRE